MSFQNKRNDKIDLSPSGAETRSWWHLIVDLPDDGQEWVQPTSANLRQQIATLIFQTPDDEHFDLADHHGHDHHHHECCHTHQGELGTTCSPSESSLSPKTESEESLKAIQARLRSQILPLLGKWFGSRSPLTRTIRENLPAFSRWLKCHPEVFERMMNVVHEIETFKDLQPALLATIWRGRQAILRALQRPQYQAVFTELVEMRLATMWWYFRHPDHFKRTLLLVSHFIKWIRHHSAIVQTDLLPPLVTIRKWIQKHPMALRQLVFFYLFLLKWVHDHHDEAIQARELVTKTLVLARQKQELIQAILHFEELIACLPKAQMAVKTAWKHLRGLAIHQFWPEISAEFSQNFRKLVTELEVLMAEHEPLLHALRVLLSHLFVALAIGKVKPSISNE